MSCTHEKVVYTICGCVQRQCRCIDGGQNVRTIPGPCPRHVGASAAGDDALTLAEAIALPPKDVECCLVPDGGPEPQHWICLEAQQHLSLAALRVRMFRRRHPTRSRVQEMAEKEWGPTSPAAAHSVRERTATIMIVCEAIATGQFPTYMPAGTTSREFAAAVVRYFLEPQ